MVLFFIPYEVGMMVYSDALQELWIPIIFTTVKSTIITPFVVEKLIKLL